VPVQITRCPNVNMLLAENDIAGLRETNEMEEMAVTIIFPERENLRKQILGDLANG
jgi:hypothetical protein